MLYSEPFVSCLHWVTALLTICVTLGRAASFMVTSAVVRMYPRKPEQLHARDEAHLSQLVAQAFSQRRKMLRNTLSDMPTQEQLIACGIAPTARAEELSVAQFVNLSNYLLAQT